MRPKRSRLFAVFVLIVLANWSAATAHCTLEAIGWLPDAPGTEQGCCTTSDDCDNDLCDVVEDENYAAPSNDTLVAAPDLYVDFCLRCVWEASLLRANGVPPDESHERALSSPSTLGETLRVAHTVVLRC